MFNKITKILVTLLFVLSFTSYANAQTIRIASVSGPSHHHNTALNWFADKLNKQLKIGLLVSDMMLKLGLLGTIVGFILMLAPISNIDAYDVSTLKTALSSMSGGMAIALFTTLAGLVGGILLRTQYYLLDEANEELFSNIAQISETKIIPIIINSK